MDFVLEFERPIVELRRRIEGLQEMQRSHGTDLSEAINQLNRQAEVLLDQVFSSLTPWQQTLLSRHPSRPYTLDYVRDLFTDWTELHGDRAGHEDHAIVGGLARFGDTPVVVIGHQKGRKTVENIKRNFGMARPDGYRKALRLMELANRFGRPILTFIDTPGAYPGLDAEERGQAEAIARNIMEMSTYKVPIICTIIGEGGSGGALAVGVGNRVLMLENSVYSVISPEGCASILWKKEGFDEIAANCLKLTSSDLVKLNVIDEVISEPLGGAHRDIDKTIENVKQSLVKNLEELNSSKQINLISLRRKKYLKYGSTLRV